MKTKFSFFLAILTSSFSYAAPPADSVRYDFGRLQAEVSNPSEKLTRDVYVKTEYFPSKDQIIQTYRFLPLPKEGKSSFDFVSTFTRNPDKTFTETVALKNEVSFKGKMTPTGPDWHWQGWISLRNSICKKATDPKKASCKPATGEVKVSFSATGMGFDYQLFGPKKAFLSRMQGTLKSGDAKGFDSYLK